MKFMIYILASILISANLYSQEIGISPTKIWTDNYEIENPIGFSVYYFQSIGKLGVKLEYVTAKNERNYYGVLNGGFLVGPEDFVRESVVSKSSYSSIEISAIYPKLFELLQNHLNIGAGISFDKFTRDKTGLSYGKTYNDKENKFGLFYMVSISRHNILGLPVRLEILFKSKALLEGNFATDIEQPFTGAISMQELQFNVGYVF